VAAILILGVQAPFTWGGQDVLVQTLAAKLREHKHQVDIVSLPLSMLPKEGLLKQAAIWRSIELEHFGGVSSDLVIATKFPSYYARHPRKSLWLVHQHRMMYELYGSRFSDFSDDPRDEALRSMLLQGDRKMLAECAFVSGISQNVVQRLKLFNGSETPLNAVALYPPLPLGDRYYCAEAQDYVLSVGRLCSIKRVDLMIKAMPYVHRFVKLKVVGVENEPGVMDYFRNEIDKHHLWDRVEFLGRVSDQELLDLYARARIVYYAPHDEDYGYVTLEAMASCKPVLTAHDSGGVLEFIRDNEQGLVLEPTSLAFGQAVNRLVEDPALAQRLGACGRQTICALGLHTSGWEPVLQGLLSPLPASERGLGAL
jgi:glycosyltransferase involved in cell wall biosynthesis